MRAVSSALEIANFLPIIFGLIFLPVALFAGFLRFEFSAACFPFWVFFLSRDSLFFPKEREREREKKDRKRRETENRSEERETYSEKALPTKEDYQGKQLFP